MKIRTDVQKKSGPPFRWRMLIYPTPLHRWVAQGDYSPKRMTVFLTIRCTQLALLFWYGYRILYFMIVGPE